MCLFSLQVPVVIGCPVGSGNIFDVRDVFAHTQVKRIGVAFYELKCRVVIDKGTVIMDKVIMDGDGYRERSIVYPVWVSPNVTEVSESVASFCVISVP